MSLTINRIRIFGIIGAVALLITPFINVAVTFADGGGSVGSCGGC